MRACGRPTPWWSLASAASQRSRWCFAELILARALGVRIFPVRVADAAPHPAAVRPAMGRPGQRGRGRARAPALVASAARIRSGACVRDATRAVAVPRSARVPVRRRRRLLRARGGDRRAAARALALVGPSGTGSRRSCTPACCRAYADAADWAVLPPVFPGHEPLAALARSLAHGPSEAGSPDDWAQIHERSRHEPERCSTSFTTSQWPTAKCRHGSRPCGVETSVRSTTSPHRRQESLV